jgi:hypothetical protein
VCILIMQRRGVLRNFEVIKHPFSKKCQTATVIVGASFSFYVKSTTFFIGEHVGKYFIRALKHE